MGSLAVCNVLGKIFQRQFAITSPLLHKLSPLTNVLCCSLMYCYSRLTILTGLNEKYKLRFTCVQSSVLSSPRMAQFGHYPNGPTLNVECCEFLPTDITQISVVRKNLSGWNWMFTTAYCMTNPQIDISPYLQKFSIFSMDEASRRPRYPTSFFFRTSASL